MPFDPEARSAKGGTDEAAHNAGMGTGSARRDDVSGANIAIAEIPWSITAMGRINKSLTGASHAASGRRRPCR